MSRGFLSTESGAGRGGTQKSAELCREAGQPGPELEERVGEVVVRFIPGTYSPPREILETR